MLILALLILTSAVPTIVFHEVNDNCGGVTRVADMITEETGEFSECMELFTPNPVIFSDVASIQLQGGLACKKIKENPIYENGFNIVAFSQGGIVGRYVVQMCSVGDKVESFVTFGSPHGG